MARDRYRIRDRTAPYFLTCTAIEWLPVFAQPANANILLDSLSFLQARGRLTLYGYVILENHCHLLASAPDRNKSMASFKSFTAGQIIARMKADNSPGLRLLSLHKARHKVDREHQLWQEGSHPKEIRDEATMRQKLDYIHLNPVKRGYVDDPAHWRYSSARNYAGMEGVIEVVTLW
jgi:REP element-mobilizing transposase RayT